MIGDKINQRLQELSTKCVDTHTAEDIWEHLEEELSELLLAIKRVKRGKEPFLSVIEELVDVKMEINTVLTLIAYPELINGIFQQKLDKFETMLNNEKAEHEYKGVTLSLVKRYKPIEIIK